MIPNLALEKIGFREVKTCPRSPWLVSDSQNSTPGLFESQVRVLFLTPLLIESNYKKTCSVSLWACFFFPRNQSKQISESHYVLTLISRACFMCVYSAPFLHECNQLPSYVSDSHVLWKARPDTWRQPLVLPVGFPCTSHRSPVQQLPCCMRFLCCISCLFPHMTMLVPNQFLKICLGGGQTSLRANNEDDESSTLEK